MIAQMRDINIEADWVLLDTTSTEKRHYQYNKLLLDRYQYFDYLDRSLPLYLGYITSIFSTSSPIQYDPGPTCRNTSRRSYHLRVF